MFICTVIILPSVSVCLSVRITQNSCWLTLAKDFGGVWSLWCVTSKKLIRF